MISRDHGQSDFLIRKAGSLRRRKLGNATYPKHEFLGVHMRQIAISFLLMALLAWNIVFAESPKEKTAGAIFEQGQNSSFQIEEWEKGLNERQPPNKIMDAIGLRRGMIIGEVGAGTGRMTVWLADRVGEAGKVFANDIEGTALDHLRRRCKRDGIKNVEIIRGRMDDPKFPVATLDIAFMINVYHHLADPVQLIRNIRPSLTHDGMLAIVECDPDKVSWGDEHGCTGKESMIAILKKAGFEVVRIENFLEEDSLYIAKPIVSLSDLYRMTKVWLTGVI